MNSPPNVETGLPVACQQAQVQSFLFANVEMEGVQTGLYVRHVSECPDGQVVNTFCQYRNVGFDLANIHRWRILSDTFRIEGSIAVPAYDIRFLATNVAIVGLSKFESGTSRQRVNIQIDADAAVNGTAKGENILVESNIFGETDTDVPGAPFATSAVQTTPGAQNFRIGASNMFNRPFSGPVVADPAGAVTTQVGFPTTNNPANPAAVLPNGNTTIGQPTLGNATADGTWPQTFSVGYTLPQAIPKIAPTSGWKFYVDINDGNKLKAIYSNGTWVTLGTP